jgi:hypothetical protein
LKYSPRELLSKPVSISYTLNDENADIKKLPNCCRSAKLKQLKDAATGRSIR